VLHDGRPGRLSNVLQATAAELQERRALHGRRVRLCLQLLALIHEPAGPPIVIRRSIKMYNGAAKGFGTGDLATASEVRVVGCGHDA
jgi:hypothetical protein